MGSFPPTLAYSTGESLTISPQDTNMTNVTQPTAAQVAPVAKAGTPKKASSSGVASRPVGRPPLLGKPTGARRGRPPRNPRPPPEAANSSSTSNSLSYPAPAPGVIARPPLQPPLSGATHSFPASNPLAGSALRHGWTPSLTVQKQQALLTRAMQVSQAQSATNFTPFHALLQMGFLFVRHAQLPAMPSASLSDGVVLRLDEASSLGVLPPQLVSKTRMPMAGMSSSTSTMVHGVSSKSGTAVGSLPANSSSTFASPMSSTVPTTQSHHGQSGSTSSFIDVNTAPLASSSGWPELPTYLPGHAFVDGGAPPAKSAVDMPVTTQNTRLTKLPSTEPVDPKVWKPMSPKTKRELRATMESDAAFSTRKARQDKAMDTELYMRVSNLMQPSRPLPWWERSRAMDTSSSPHTGSLQIIFPAQRQRHWEHLGLQGMRTRLSLKGENAKRVSSLPETLVPIRLDLEHEPFKLRDTFLWNAVEDETSLDLFAASICEDLGVPPKVFMELIKVAVQSQVNEYATNMALRMSDNAEDDENTDGGGHLNEAAASIWLRLRERVLNQSTKHMPGTMEPVAENHDTPEASYLEDTENMPDNKIPDELRVLIKIDILVGGTHLIDQFEWDLLARHSHDAETFAATFAAELGLAGEFKTAIAHSIREQATNYLRALAVLGYPFNQLASLDEDIRACFLPAVSPSLISRPHESLDAYTPKLIQLNSTEVLHLEREHERESRRKRRQTKGRRGTQNVDIEPQRTIRSLPLYGFQGAMPEMERPQPARRAAAAAAASLASGSSTAPHELSPGVDESSVFLPSTKRIKHDWYDMYFRYPGGLGSESEAGRTQPSTSSALDTMASSTTAKAPTLGTHPDPTFAPTPSLASRHVRPEDLERQHPTMHDGVWHCANCGMPGYLDAARRKGPAGEKTLCGPCGKYYHRHRRMPSVLYSRDPAHHSKKPRESTPVLDASALTHEQDVSLTESEQDTQGPPPLWLVHAVDACRSKYKNDRFLIQMRARPPDAIPDGDLWRIKCLDCPGKVYKPGPGESLANFEIHLKNRSHRLAVSRRLGGDDDLEFLVKSN